MRRWTLIAACVAASTAQGFDRSIASEDTILKLIDRNSEIPRTRALTFGAQELAPSKIWIHIRTPEQRADAAAILEMLEDGVRMGPVTRDVSLSPIQEVSIGPETAQVRFFKDEDRTTANEIARQLSEAGMPTAATSFVDAFKDASYIDIGHIEIWLPDGEGGALSN
ncbi:MAG: hypothetical protein AAGB18_00425 [Pseudomonadota bacterium]